MVYFEAGTFFEQSSAEAVGFSKLSSPDLEEICNSNTFLAFPVSFILIVSLSKFISVSINCNSTIKIIKIQALK